MTPTNEERVKLLEVHQVGILALYAPVYAALETVVNGTYPLEFLPLWPAVPGNPKSSGTYSARLRAGALPKAIERWTPLSSGTDRMAIETWRRTDKPALLVCGGPEFLEAASGRAESEIVEPFFVLAHRCPVSLVQLATGRADAANIETCKWGGRHGRLPGPFATPPEGTTTHFLTQQFLAEEGGVVTACLDLKGGGTAEEHEGTVLAILRGGGVVVTPDPRALVSWLQAKGCDCIHFAALPGMVFPFTIIAANRAAAEHVTLWDSIREAVSASVLALSLWPIQPLAGCTGEMAFRRCESPMPSIETFLPETVRGEIEHDGEKERLWFQQLEDFVGRAVYEYDARFFEPWLYFALGSSWRNLPTPWRTFARRSAAEWLTASDHVAGGAVVGPKTGVAVRGGDRAGYQVRHLFPYAGVPTEDLGSELAEARKLVTGARVELVGNFLRDRRQKADELCSFCRMGAVVKECPFGREQENFVHIVRGECRAALCRWVTEFIGEENEVLAALREEVLAARTPSDFKRLFPLKWIEDSIFYGEEAGTPCAASTVNAADGSKLHVWAHPNLSGHSYDIAMPSTIFALVVAETADAAVRGGGISSVPGDRPRVCISAQATADETSVTIRAAVSTMSGRPDGPTPRSPYSSLQRVWAVAELCGFRVQMESAGQAGAESGCNVCDRCGPGVILTKTRRRGT